MADDKKKEPKPPVVVPQKGDDWRKLGAEKPKINTQDPGEKRRFNEDDKKKK